jgi:acetyl esterase/lipase
LRDELRHIAMIVLATALLGASGTVDSVRPPAVVGGLSCVSRPGPEVECSWNGLATAPAGYRLEWQNLTGTVREQAETTLTSVTVWPATPGMYQFRVYAFERSPWRNTAVRGPGSRWETVPTEPPLSSTTAEPVDAVEAAYGTHPRQRYLAVLPPTPTGGRPAVIVVHGGFWIRGDATGSSYEINRRLYELGYPSFAVNYRLAQDAPWPAQRDDVFAALGHIREHAREYGVDPERIAAVGPSAGGHLALWLASHGQGRESVRAVVAYSAPTNAARIQSDVRSLPPLPTTTRSGTRTTGSRAGSSVGTPAPGTTTPAAVAPTPETPAQLSRALSKQERGWVTTLGRAATILTGDDPAGCGPVCRSLAPQSEASAGDAPALLFAGEQEWLDHRHASDYAMAYRAVQDAEVELRVLSGERRHALGYAGARADVWQDTITWLRRHL